MSSRLHRPTPGMTALKISSNSQSLTASLPGTGAIPTWTSCVFWHHYGWFLLRGQPGRLRPPDDPGRALRLGAPDLLVLAEPGGALALLRLLPAAAHPAAHAAGHRGVERHAALPAARLPGDGTGGRAAI